MSKYDMIVEGLIRNIRTTLFNKRTMGINSDVFYVEPEYQHKIISLLKEEGYKVYNTALYELKVKWEDKPENKEKDNASESNKS